MTFLEIKNISKSFGGIHALSNVSFTVEKGEIHGICGENGAGKSTLIKILSGVYPSSTYDGEIFLAGKKKSFSNIHDAEQAGIAVIHQELSAVKNMTVGENIFLGREPQRFGIINFNEIYSRSSRLLKEVGLKISPQAQMMQLGIGEQQLVEIAKAINKNASLLILDEPTTALAAEEIEKLMHILFDLKSKGVTIIYISHKLNEVLRICNRISVLRDGTYITTRNAKEISERELISLMVGREVKDFYPRVNAISSDVILSVRHLTLYDPEVPSKKKIDDVSFEIRKGEILGISGLMGAGRTELLTAIFGAWKGKYSREILLNGNPVFFKSPEEAIKNGLALVSEDRKRFGLIINHSVGKNLALASLREIALRGILNFSREMKRNFDTIKSIGIKVMNPELAVNTLSGGNQQKVVLGKWLLSNPQVLFLDEPTRGIDVGARNEIYILMNELVRKGMAVVMVSSDLPEVLGMSNRILVLHEGKITAELQGEKTNQEEVMLAATGQLKKSA